MLSNVCIFVVWDLSYEGMLVQIMSVRCLGTEWSCRKEIKLGTERNFSSESSVGNITSVSARFRIQSICLISKVPDLYILSDISQSILGHFSCYQS